MRTSKKLMSLILVMVMIFANIGPAFAEVSSPNTYLENPVEIISGNPETGEVSEESSQEKETQEPAAEAEEPATEAEEPATEAEEPAAEVEEPAAEGEEPAADTGEPVREAEEPASEGESGSDTSESEDLELVAPIVEPAELNLEMSQSPPSSGTAVPQIETIISNPLVTPGSFGAKVHVEKNDYDSWDEEIFIVYTSDDQVDFETYDKTITNLNTVNGLNYIKLDKHFWLDSNQAEMNIIYDLLPDTTYYYGIGVGKRLAGDFYYDFLVMNESFTTLATRTIDPPSFEEVSARPGHYSSNVKLRLLNLQFDLYKSISIEVSQESSFADPYSWETYFGAYDYNEANSSVWLERDFQMENETVFYRTVVTLTQNGTETKEYGEIKSFTRVAKPTGAVITIDSITGSRANISGQVTGFTNDRDGMYFIAYSKDPDFKQYDTSDEIYFEHMTNEFKRSVFNIEEGEQYYFRLEYMGNDEMIDTAFASNVVSGTSTPDKVLELADFDGNTWLYNYLKERYSSNDPLTLSDMSHVDRLYFSGDQVVSLVGIGNIPNLKKLDIHNAPNLLSLQGLEKAMTLNEFSYRGSQISRFDEIKLLKLKSLDLSDCGISDATFVKDMVTLEKLNLRNNRLTTLPDLRNLVNLIPGGVENNHYQLYTDFGQNQIGLYFNANYLPVNLLDNKWIFEQLESQLSNRPVSVTVLDTFYKVDGKRPFAIEILNGFETRFDLTLTINGISKNFTSDQRYFVFDDLTTEFPILTDNESIKVTVKNAGDKHLIYDLEKPVSFVESNIWLTKSSQYRSVNEKEDHITVYFSGEYSADQIGDIYLLKADGSKVATRIKEYEYNPMAHNNVNLGDSRYDDTLYYFDAKPKSTETFISVVLYNVEDLTLGTYDLEAVVDGQVRRLTSAVKVVDVPVVRYTNTFVRDYERPTFSSNDVYISINGINIDPDIIRPAIYDMAGNKIAGAVEYKINRNEIIYRLSKASDVSWPIDYTIEIESSDGSYFVDASRVERERFHRYTTGVHYIDVDPILNKVYMVSADTIGSVLVEILDGSTNELLASGSGNISAKTGAVNLNNLVNNFSFQEGVHYTFKVSQDHYTYQSGRTLYDFEDGYTTPQNTLNTFNSEIFDVDTGMMMNGVLEYTSKAFTSVNASLIKDGNLVAGPFTLEVKDLIHNEKRVKGFEQSVDFGQTLSAGSYQIKYDLLGTSPEVITRNVTVYNNNLVHVPWISDRYYDDKLSITFRARNRDVKLNDFTYEIYDLLGNVITGTSHVMRRHSNDHSYYYLDLSNLPAGKSLFKIKLMYKGEAFRSLGDVSQSIYASNPRELLFEKNRVVNYSRFSYDNYKLINGFNCLNEDYPVTLKISYPYDTRILKSLTATEDRPFVLLDLEGLDLNRKYDLHLFDKNGLMIKHREAVKLEVKTNTSIPVRGVSISDYKTEIKVSETYEFKASISPSNASNKSVIWSSSDESVARIDEFGLVTGLKEGQVTIRVKSLDGNFEASTSVRITPAPKAVTGIMLDKTSLDLFVDNTATLNAIIAPLDADDTSVTWTSSDESVATVTNGLVTGKKAGTAIVTVKSVDGDFTATCTVEVLTPIGMTSSLTYADKSPITEVASVYTIEGEKYPLYDAMFHEETNKALILDLVGTGSEIEDDADYKLVISLNNTEIKNEFIKGLDLKQGDKTLLVRTSDLLDGQYPLTINLLKEGVEKASYQYTLKIENSIIPVTGIELERETLRLKAGATYQLKPQVTPEDASNKQVNYSIVDEKNAVAEVDQNGLITAKGAGQVLVKASSDHRNYSDELTLDVVIPLEGKVDLTGHEGGFYVELRQIMTDEPMLSAHPIDGLFREEVLSVKFLDAQGGFKFVNLPVGTYKVSINGPMGYKNIVEIFEITEGMTKVAFNDLKFESYYDNLSTVKVHLKDDTGSDYALPVEVSLYNYQSGAYFKSTTIENGIVTFDHVSYHDMGTFYSLSVNTKNYSKNQWVEVKSAEETVAVEVPVRYEATGKLLMSDGSPAANMSVYLYDGKNAFYGYTNSTGDFTIGGLASGDYKFKISSRSYLAEEKDVRVERENVTIGSINISKGIDVIGSLSGVNEIPFKARISLSKDNQHIESTYAGIGNYAFIGSIKEAGDYKLKISYIQDDKYNSIQFVSTPVEFTVTEEDIKTALASGAGRMTKDLSYERQINASQVFTGLGNLAVVDRPLVQEGATINLIAKYKNNGNTPVNANFIVTLPSGLTTNESTSHSVLVPVSSEGMFSLPLEVSGLTETYATIKVEVEMDGQTYDFAIVNIEKMVAVLNGPETTKVGQEIKVYGEATASSSIVIKDANTGKIYSATQANGRWYNSSIVFEQVGTYNLIAVVTANGKEEVSEVLTVNVSADPLEIVSIKNKTQDGNELPVNPLINVRAFTAWVNSKLEGRDITISTQFNKDNIESVTYHFADRDYIASKSGDYYTAVLSGWSGAGLKTITATVVTSDGRTIEFIIAEVTILIDPSGYVLDQETGLRLEGVKVICEIYENGVWSKWDANLYGQVNPQMTNEKGEYGWMVPKGTYRVVAVKDGYNYYVTTNDSNILPIEIPPVRTDVNFELVPTIKVTSLSVKDSSGNDLDELSLKEGSFKIIKYEVNPSDATNKNNITIIGNNSSVEVTKGLSQTLKVRGLNVTSDQVIVIKIGNITDSFKVTVTEGTDNNGSNNGSGDGSGSSNLPSGPVGGFVPPSTSTSKTSVKISLDKTDLELEYGTQADASLFEYDFTETITGSNETEVLWSVSDDSVVTITQEGKVKALKAGETKVKVTHLASGLSASAKVVVFLVGDEQTPLGAIEFNEAYVSGYPDGTFGPLKPVTRAEMATMFTKILKINVDNPGSAKFNDVKETAWYYNYVQAIEKTGLFVGDGDGTFRPNDPITRGELATVFVKYWSYLNIEVDKRPVYIKDVNDSQWSSEFVYTIYRAGIKSHFKDGTYRPNDPALREEVVTMVNTLIGRPNLDVDTSKFKDISKDHWAAGAIEAAAKSHFNK